MEVSGAQEYIRHLHTPQSDHHYKSSYSPSPRNRPSSPIGPPLSPFPSGDRQSVLCICACICSLYLLLVYFHLPHVSEIVRYLSWPFHLAEHPQGPSVLLQMAIACPFSRLRSTPLYVRTTSSLSSHPSVGIQVVPTSRPLWIMPQRAWPCVYLLELVFCVLQINTCTGAAGPRGCPIPIFLRCLHTVFTSGCTIFTVLPTVRRALLCPTSSSELIISCLFGNSHSNRREAVPHGGFDLLFPHRTSNMFSCACWPSVCFLWKNVY